MVSRTRIGNGALDAIQFHFFLFRPNILIDLSRQRESATVNEWALVLVVASAAAMMLLIRMTWPILAIHSRKIMECDASCNSFAEACRRAADHRVQFIIWFRFVVSLFLLFLLFFVFFVMAPCGRCNTPRRTIWYGTRSYYIDATNLY